MASWFVGLPVDPGDWLDALPPPPEGTRLLDASDLHLTLAFFGQIGEERARAAFERAAPDAIGARRIRLGALRPMGSRRRPSAYAARVHAADELTRDVEGEAEDLGEADGPDDDALASVWEPIRNALLSAASLPPEERAFRPHVTLARPRRRATPEERRRGLAWAEAVALGSPRIPLDRVALYTAAHASEAPRRYRIVLSRPLHD